MKIGVITLFPEMLSAVTDYGVTGRAIKNGLLAVDSWNPRTFTSDRHQTVDDRPYGGGPGMVMKTEPLARAIATAKQSLPGAKVLYLSPQGRRLDQAGLAELAERKSLILLAGRYEGVDERLLKAEVDEEWSVGDYVLSGGELAGMVIIDGVARLLPGVLGHEMSAVEDSFVDGLLDCPHYTRPEVYEGEQVPEVLLSGDHERIRRWRLKQALARTWERRPDLLDKVTLNDEQRELLADYQREQTRE